MFHELTNVVNVPVFNYVSNLQEYIRTQLDAPLLKSYCFKTMFFFLPFFHILLHYGLSQD